MYELNSSSLTMVLWLMLSEWLFLACFLLGNCVTVNCYSVCQSSLPLESRLNKAGTNRYLSGKK